MNNLHCNPDNNLPKIKKVTKLSKFSNSPLNFILGENLEEKIIAIYDTNMYPLLTAEENEYFDVVSSKNKKYILKYFTNIVGKKFLKAIYDNTTNKILELSKKQYAEIISEKNDVLENFYIAIYHKKEKSKVYDVKTQKIIFEGLYTDSKFETFGEYFLEIVDHKIKAIYYANGNLAIKSDTGHFIINSSFYFDGYYIQEIFDTKKCNLYIVNESFEKEIIKVHSSLNLDLSFRFNNPFNKSQKDIALILGKYNDRIKEVSLYNLKTKEIVHTMNFKISDERYFEIYKNNSVILLKVMQNEKCIKILDLNFNPLVSTIYKKYNIPRSFFELESINGQIYIKKIANSNCIAIYRYNFELKQCAATKNKDVNLMICEGQHKMIYILHMLNNKCISIQDLEGKILSGLSYEICKDYQGNLIAVYGLKDEKRVSLYSYELNCIIDYKNTSDTLLILNTFLESIEDDDFYISNPNPYTQKMLYFRCNKSNQLVELFNEKRKVILGYEDNVYYEIIDNKYILKYKNSKCICIYLISNNDISRKLYISNEENELHLHHENKGDFLIFTEYNPKENKKTLYKLNRCNDFEKIVDNYIDFCIFGNLLIIKTSKTSLYIIKKVSYNTFVSNKLTSKYNGVLTYNIVNSYAYFYEVVNEKVVSIYTLDSNNSLTKILYNKNGIEIVELDNFIFFKINGKFYNIIGNKIDISYIK